MTRGLVESFVKNYWGKRMSQKKKLNLKFIATIAIAFVIGLVTYQVSAIEAPYPPWIEKYFQRDKVPVGHDAARRLKAIYDVSIHNAANSTNGLGVYLPKNAVVTRSWYYVRTATTGHPDARVAFTCEDAGNLKAATDMTAYSANSLVEGAATGATSAMVTSIGAQCEVQAVLTGNVMSTGLIELYVDYVVHTTN